VGDDLPNRVPNAARTRVDRAKVSSYLLDESRRGQNDYKAGFFRGVLGYSDHTLLGRRLRHHVTSGRVVACVRDERFRHVKYEVEGDLVGQNGLVVNLISVWRLPDGDDARPIFVTAMPARRKRG
jgi:hypothetical protein